MAIFNGRSSNLFCWPSKHTSGFEIKSSFWSNPSSILYEPIGKIQHIYRGKLLKDHSLYWHYHSISCNCFPHLLKTFFHILKNSKFQRIHFFLFPSQDMKPCQIQYDDQLLKLKKELLNVQPFCSFLEFINEATTSPGVGKPVIVNSILNRLKSGVIWIFTTFSSNYLSAGFYSKLWECKVKQRSDYGRIYFY